MCFPFAGVGGSAHKRIIVVIVVVVVVVVDDEYNIFYINIIVGADVPRSLFFCLVFTILFACDPLKTVVLEQPPLGCHLLL